MRKPDIPITKVIENLEVFIRLSWEILVFDYFSDNQVLLNIAKYDVLIRFETLQEQLNIRTVLSMY